ncbi:hypothetical protein PUN28_003465 [Cardiocondyla obscurior]|uniref:Secreted protein n=1 Tax=Cardiocondyla obscurior TaxID=286306 RepID=A0AAW2GJ46_9HYME
MRLQKRLLRIALSLEAILFRFRFFCNAKRRYRRYREKRGSSSARRFLAGDRRPPMAKPVDREPPRWHQRPDFAGDRSRFVAISDTRCTSLMYRGGRMGS